MLQLCVRRKREALRWKLEELSERAARTPMTATGSNILGIVKHVASVEPGYLVVAFDRPRIDAQPATCLPPEAATCRTGIRHGGLSMPPVSKRWLSP
ncbi:MAG: DinB family protein, partial [Bifidobacteriaceae bacterium]|nr:DinB family protein [Bifidobacteriaceae bacterium]